MAHYEVKTRELDAYADSVKEVGNTLINLDNDIRRISNHLHFQVASTDQIRSRLHDIADSIDAMGNSVRQMGQALDNIAGEYISCEKKICGEADPLRDWKEDIQAGAENGLSFIEEMLDLGTDIDKTILETIMDELPILGEFLGIGSGIAGILTEDSGWSRALAGKDIVEAVATGLFDEGEGKRFDLDGSLTKHWWNFKEVTSQEGIPWAEKWKKFFKAEWDEWMKSLSETGDDVLKRTQNVRDIATDGLKTAGKTAKAFGESAWDLAKQGVKEVGILDVVFTVGDRGVKNAEEASSGAITNERAVVETVVESGVSILVDIGAAAAVGAAVGSVVPGPGTVVGLVAGVGGAVVVGVADCVCEWATEKFLGEKKDVAELVSDLAIDGAVAVADIATNVWEGTTDMGKKAWEGAKNVFSSWGEALAFG